MSNVHTRGFVACGLVGPHLRGGRYLGGSSIPLGDARSRRAARRSAPTECVFAVGW